MPTVDRYPPIADYALLADCHSTALVHRAGSIDWACLRRFDAGSAFGRLLDWDRGGYCALSVRDGQPTRRAYISGTLVLETHWRGPRGAAVVRDTFAMRAGGRDLPLHQLLRVIKCIDGSVDIDVTVEPRFDYGDLRPWLRTAAPDVHTAVGGDDALLIVSDVDLDIERDCSRLQGAITLTDADSARISLVSQPAHEVDTAATSVREIDSRLDETIRWWQRWSDDTRTPRHHVGLVRQSAAVLKGLTCAPTGAIVASATTSLPELIGGERNWDYRYCWIRDATLTMRALDHAGHREVASGFRQFLMRATAGHAEDLQIMYGAYGERRMPEQQVDLAGYRDSRPVRIGNAAAHQHQLDVYGHILDAAFEWSADGARLDADEWLFLRGVVDRAAEVWQRPDAGIWEMRGEPQQFVHSKVMVWVALDRGIRLAEQEARDGDVAHWRKVRDEICEMIERRGVARDGTHFTQVLDGTAVDAALLKLPLVGFVDARDPRMLATTDAIRSRLETPDGLLRRYECDGDDGLPGSEAPFLLCNFWLVEVLALQGDVDAAQHLFDRVLTTGNDVGLFAEEYDPSAGELRGNFPQAFTHLGLVQAAFRLERARDAAVSR